MYIHLEIMFVKLATRLSDCRGEITAREASPNEPRFGPKVLPKQLKDLKEFRKKLAP
jgi:hypothetical protein